MKLRNKKTGMIIDFEESNSYFLYDCGDKIVLGKNSEEPVYGYSTLKEFIENWEDYNSKESLIKDKKIRKVVRAWADIVPESEFRYNRFERKLYTISKYILPFSISFPTNLDLIEMKDYTLEELCGEEEE